MSYRALLFLTAILFPAVTFSQGNNIKTTAAPIDYTATSIYVSNGMCGVLGDDGEILIPAKYDYIEPCSGMDPSFAKVYKNDKCGVLGPDGTEVIPIIYDLINYRYPFFLVVLDGKWGMFDRDWRERIRPAKYDWISPFKADRAVVQVGDKYGVVDAWGREVADIKYDDIGRLAGKVFLGVLDDSCYIITPAGKANPLKSLRARHCQDGAYVYEQDGKWGVVDKNGKETVRPLYDLAAPYGDLIIVERGKKYGAIDVNGKVLIPLNYDVVGYDDVHHSIQAEREDYFAHYLEAQTITNKDGWFVGFKSDGGKDYFDFSGRNIGESGTKRIKYLYEQRQKRERYKLNGFLIDIEEVEYDGWLSPGDYYLTDANLRPIGEKWENLRVLHSSKKKDDRVFAAGTNSRYYILGDNGEVLSGPYEQIMRGVLDAWVVKRNGVYEIVDRYGKSVSPIRSSLYIEHAGGQVYLERIEENHFADRYVIRNIKGEALSDEIRGKPSVRWSDERAWRLVGDKYGALDLAGTFVIAPQYDEVEPFSDGLALVRPSGSTPEYKVVGRDGRTVFQVPNGWEPVDNRYYNGMMQFRDADGNRVFVNRLGETVFSLDPKEYADSVGHFSSLGLLKVQSAETGLWGFFSKRGHDIFPCTFSEASDYEWDSLQGLYYATVKEEDNDTLYYMDSEGNMIYDFFPSSAHILDLTYRLFYEFWDPETLEFFPERPLENYYNSDYDFSSESEDR